MEGYKAMLGSKGARMDLMHADPYMCSCHRYFEEGRMCILCHPFHGYNVSTITFCGMLVWKSKNGHCKGLSMSQNDGSYTFNLSILDGTESSKLSFTLFEMESKITSTLTNACTPKRSLVDVRINVMGRVDVQNVECHGYKRGRTTTYVYSPYPEVRVNFVFRDHVKIWQATDAYERCLKVEYTHYHEGSSFIHFLTSGPSGFRHWYLQAIGQNGSYNEITRRDYMAKRGISNGNQNASA